MNIPQGATHYLAGDFYHERGDGQFLMHVHGNNWDRAMISDSTEARLWPLSDDLTWLAVRCDNWVSEYRYVSRFMGDQYVFRHDGDRYTKNQWLTRRRELGLEAELPVTPEEDEAWNELERRQEDRRHDPAKHYSREYRGIKLDPYRVARVYKMQGGPREQIMKKCLRFTDKGQTEREVLNEIKSAMARWEQMLDEDGM